MKKVILDTNGYSKLLKGDGMVQAEIEEALSVYLPVIVIGELFAGFKNGLHETKNKQLLEKFMLKPSVIVISVTEETAGIYSQIVHLLRKQGTPIPVNDVWIASCAIEVGAVIITYDEHFSKIPGIRVWDKI